MARKRKKTPVIHGDYLEVIPMKSEDIEVFTAEDGRTTIRRVIEPKTRLGRFCEKKWGWRKETRINLDTNGSLFWNRIDGTRSLKEIEVDVRNELKLSRKESVDAAVAFVKMLMARGLVGLYVPEHLRNSDKENHG